MISLSKTNLTLAGIIIIGAILRLYNLAAIPLWHDEAFSALLIRYPFGEMINRIILDVHPPLYYILLRVWDFVLGDSLFSLRLFSAFFSVLTIYFAYLFVKAAFKNERLALISALLIATNPFQIQYSVEARMYTLGTFLIVLSSWLLTEALENSSSKAIAKNYNEKIISPINKWWIFYGLSAAAAIYTHYYLIFSVAAQGIFILFIAFKKYNKNIAAWIKGEIARGAIFACSIAFLLFIPWISIFFKQLGQVEANYWIPEMTASSIPNTLWKMFSGSNIEVGNSMLAMVAIIFLFVFYVAIKRQRNNYRWLVIFSFIIPFILAIIISFKRSLYLDRYFVFAGLFYLIIFSLFIEAFRNKLIKNWVLIILIALSLFLFAQNWKTINPANKPGMKGASAYILKQNLPQDKVYVASSFIYFTFKYYDQQNYLSYTLSNLVPAKPLLYTPGVTKISQLPHFSGTALLNNSDLLNDFSRDVKPDDTIWLLWTTGFGSGKPEVPKNWTQINEVGFQDVFDYKGWIVVTRYRVQ